MKHAYIESINRINSYTISSWDDISITLNSIKSRKYIEVECASFTNSNYLEHFQSGIAFVTFDYGIDGVSIEIKKYATCLEKLYWNKLDIKLPLHFIGGDFHDKADIMLKPDWNRFQIPDFNGWSKWSHGKWFSKLFYEEMSVNSTESKIVAKEIWTQAVGFSIKLIKYILENNIKLLIPVNICSNPGNPAAALAIIIASELLNINVISSNHDFYWEGGKPNRPKNEAKGPRDHFFKNCTNKSFFNLFKSIYPWNGKKWTQVNINTLQTNYLVEKLNFKKNKVCEISTCISDDFFYEYCEADIKTARRKMNYILSNGNPVVETTRVEDFSADLNNWMKKQSPTAISFNQSHNIDLTSQNIFYFLQPTRIVSRKRIYKDIELIAKLMQNKTFSDNCKDNEYKLILHITGPVPIEHQADLEDILNKFRKVCSSIPAAPDKLFIVLSVGTENHSSFAEHNLNKLTIEEIYRLADIILFPSETEGRGLPIIESSAAGIPIVCSEYYPQEVFFDVIGNKLDDYLKIRYIHFPENNVYPDEILKKISSQLFSSSEKLNLSKHNKQAVKARYGELTLINKFDSLLKAIEN